MDVRQASVIKLLGVSLYRRTAPGMAVDPDYGEAISVTVGALEC